ncbi:GtrA family protein [Robertmurraya sp.]|uniref:GtrA family protein n=1 Tax=Robertmurraya sp. TaxID=2837525 RepID=UPI0037047C65
MKRFLVKKIRYLIVGSITTIVNLISYWLAVNIFLFDYRTGTAIAWLLAVLFAYYANKKYVFESKNKNITKVLKEISLFFLLRFFSFLIDLVAMMVLVSGLNNDDFTAKLLSNVLVLIVNYIFSNNIVFRKESTEMVKGALK